MNAIDLLRKDDKMVMDLFKQYEKLDQNENEKKQAVFDDIRSCLDIHFGIEEFMFYPMVIDALVPEKKGLIVRGLEDQRFIKVLLGDLAMTRIHDSRFDAKMGSLKENVMRYIEDEENKLLPEAEACFATSELDVMGEEIQRKAQVLKPVLYVTFPDVIMTERAVAALLDNGVQEEDMSLIVNESGSGLKKTLTGEDLEDPMKEAQTGVTMTTGSDTAAGAAKGAGIGLLIGVLAGLASLAIPGVGLVVGGGALATAIGSAVGTTVAGALAGGVVGLLKDQGVPEETAKRYSDALSRGGAILAIALPSGELNQMKVRQIVSKYGAANFSSYARPLKQQI